MTMYGTTSIIIDDENLGLALENEVAVFRVVLSDSTAKPNIDYLILSKKWVYLQRL